MINCLIIDDEQHAIDLIERYVIQTPFLNLVKSTTDAVEGLGYLNKNKVDLVFLDVHMPKISGIELLSIITCKVILTTAYSEYAMDGYEHGVVDYLLKPITYSRFLKAAQKAYATIKIPFVDPMKPDDVKEEQSGREYLFIKGEHKGRQVKIEFEQIEYIESLKNYVAFHCKTEKSLALMTMKDLEELLPTRHFARIHNSYIIPLNKVIAIESNQVILRRTNNKEISLPIGVTYRAAFFNLINR